ncbi:MAG: DUF523 domain-containing protein [Acidaminococcaceae bacterium]|nr:DUF523 domain-containing protein [Acidaminococcaceae bacterium]
MILISACLAGRNVKYNGGNNAVPWLCQWIERHKDQVLLVCPEMMGGLPVPRLPAEIQICESDSGGFLKNRRVVNKAGEDVTEQFLLGVAKVLELVKQHHITSAIMKSNSPSCSGSYIYDGTFSGTRIAGQGITAALLMEHGVKVYSEKTLTPELLEELMGRFD